MKILDSDFLIAFLRGNPESIPMARMLMKEGIFSTTTMNSIELYIGAYGSQAKTDAVTRLLSKFDILPLDEGAAKLVADVFASCVKKGEMIDIKDAIIAGIALKGDHTVVTRNVKHFDCVEGLAVEQW